MNIIDKYIDNLQENKELYRKISKLCCAYLMNGNDMRMSIRNKIATKLIKWEFSDPAAYYPNEITITYIVVDAKTLEQTEECAKMSWHELLIGEEIIDKNNEDIEND